MEDYVIIWNLMLWWDEIGNPMKEYSWGMNILLGTGESKKGIVPWSISRENPGGVCSKRDNDEDVYKSFVSPNFFSMES